LENVNPFTNEKRKEMKTTLLIMAAGIGSRFGTGIKQLEPVDDSNHIIMDYSIHDAIEAGFNHIVFIIRKDIEEEFKEVIGNRIAKICEKYDVTVDYAFQDINDIPGTLPEGRTKPWGTGQAVLAAKNILDTPFIVINADDYYGKEGFKAVHEYLVNGGKSCMAGFVLKNTLSDNGGVTRGICKMDTENNLTEVVETGNIIKTENGAEADGVTIDTDSLVSMNMWGLTPDFLEVLEEGFKEFFEKEVVKNPLKAEYLIPTFIGELLEQGKISVKVLRSNDTWYGMTYKEDVVSVRDSFNKMLKNGVYKADLFSDL
jgi:UTP-glucose-1-phosphate uridylyltransferase